MGAEGIIIRGFDFGMTKFYVFLRVTIYMMDLIDVLSYLDGTSRLVSCTLNKMNIYIQYADIYTIYRYQMIRF